MKKHVLTPLRWKDWETFCEFRGAQIIQVIYRWAFAVAPALALPLSKMDVYVCTAQVPQEEGRNNDRGRHQVGTVHASWVGKFRLMSTKSCEISSLNATLRTHYSAYVMLNDVHRLSILIAILCDCHVAVLLLLSSCIHPVTHEETVIFEENVV